jgi:hypothetical protein
MTSCGTAVVRISWCSRRNRPWPCGDNSCVAHLRAQVPRVVEFSTARLAAWRLVRAVKLTACQDKTTPTAGSATLSSATVSNLELHAKRPRKLAPPGSSVCRVEALTVASFYLPQHHPEGPVCCDCRRSREGRHD